jgi:hypothetical protein
MIIIGIIRINALSLIGKNSFHVKYIKLSYRIRGRVARIQIKIVAIIIVLIINDNLVKNGTNPEKKIVVKSLIIKMFAYSAIKINANNPLLYSTLNPETSSDSPSAKSNGVRFVSAKLVVNHIRDRGKIIIVIQDIRLVEMIDISICILIINDDRRINDILTSYEIVWATPRSAPSSAYFELEHQPAINVVYTFILDTHRKYNTPNEMKIAELLCG